MVGDAPQVDGMRKGVGAGVGSLFSPESEGGQVQYPGAHLISHPHANILLISSRLRSDVMFREWHIMPGLPQLRVNWMAFPK